MFSEIYAQFLPKLKLWIVKCPIMTGMQSQDSAQTSSQIVRDTEISAFTCSVKRPERDPVRQ